MGLKSNEINSSKFICPIFKPLKINNFENPTGWIKLLLLKCSLLYDKIPIVELLLQFVTVLGTFYLQLYIFWTNNADDKWIRM